VSYHCIYDKDVAPAKDKTELYEALKKLKFDATLHMIKDESELREKLGEVIDFYLDHDREIYSPSDDSIAFCVGDEVIFTRTSRGLNPNFIHTNFKQKGTIWIITHF